MHLLADSGRRTPHRRVGRGLLVWLLLGAMVLTLSAVPSASAAKPPATRITVARAESPTVLLVQWSSRAKGLHRVLASGSSDMRSAQSARFRGTSGRLTDLTAGRTYYLQVVPLKKGRALRRAASRPVAVVMPRSATPAPARPATPTSVPTRAAAVDGSVSFRPVSGFYGAQSEFVRDVSRAPLAPDSAGVVANLADQVRVRYNGIAGFNVWQFNTGFYRVTAATPRVRVKFDNCQNKPKEPPELYSPSRGAVFVDVPIPDDAKPAVGSDATLSLWDPAQDKFWELWKAARVNGQWQACWGGRIDSWSTSKGFFTPGYTGVAATGLSIAAGVIGIEEMRAGRIDHALNLHVVDTRHWSEFSYPAQRSDGAMPVGTPNVVGEGQRLRLDPSVDVDSLRLTPIGRAVARAAQTYGFIVTDRAGAVAVQTESGAGVAEQTGTNPWGPLMQGQPAYNIMRNFPWDRLQAIAWDHGRP